MACLTVGLELAGVPRPLVPDRLVILGLVVTFALALVWITGPGLTGRQPRVTAALLLWQTALGTVVDTDLMYVVALLLPFVYARRTAARWIIARNLLGMPVFVYIAHRQLAGGSAWDLAMGIIPHLVWQAFSFMIGLVAMTERQRRDELARTNAELATAQRCLTEQTRHDERLEISRELHDNLGHHLAALNVQLELARHHTDGAAHAAVTRAQGTGRQLLAELRGVVSAWRADASDLPAALDQLARAIDAPAITVTVDPTLDVAPALAGPLFRCAQELVANAVRHADARNVWLGLSSRGAGVCLSARDDGTGQPAVVAGNGLRGLRERATALGGQVDIQTAPGRGFAVEIWVPLGEATT